MGLLIWRSRGREVVSRAWGDKARGCRVSCVLCRVSCVLCPVSCVVCPVSCVLCRVSCVVCRVSCVVCRVSCVVCRVSCVLCRVSCVLCPVSCVVCLVSCACVGALECHIALLFLSNGISLSRMHCRGLCDSSLSFSRQLNIHTPAPTWKQDARTRWWGCWHPAHTTQCQQNSLVCNRASGPSHPHRSLFLYVLPCEEVRRATPQNCSLSLPACRNFGGSNGNFLPKNTPKEPETFHGNTESNTKSTKSWLPWHTYGSVLQCVAVCCSVLQCVAVCCSVLQCFVWARTRLERWSARELSAASPPAAQPLA